MKKKIKFQESETMNSTIPDTIKIQVDKIQPLELNVGGQLNASGADLQAVVDKLNELIKKG